MIDVVEELRSVSYDTLRAIWAVGNIRSIFRMAPNLESPEPVCEELAVGMNAVNDLVRPWRRDQNQHFIAGYLKISSPPVPPANVFGQLGSCYHAAAFRWAVSRLRAVESTLEAVDIEYLEKDFATTVHELLTEHSHRVSEWCNDVGDVGDVEIDGIEAFLALELESAISTLPQSVREQAAVVDDSITEVKELADVPAEFRFRGYANGEPLTVKIIKSPEKYGIKGPYLTRMYRGPRLKLGREFIYKHSCVTVLADHIRRPGDRAD